MALSSNSSATKIAELAEFLTPSKPVQSEEYLEGRINELERVDEILSFGGRSIFIVGERGVGKTSLAQTAAVLHTHSNYEYIYTACDPKPYGTFGKLAKDLLIKLAQLASEHQKESIETKSKMSLLLSTNPSVKFTKEWSKSKSTSDIPEPEGAADVIRYLQGFGKLLKEPLCIILDELENLDSDECRANLAHLIKQIGDQEIPFKFLFSGIGDTPTKLVGVHESTSRYYGAIPLEPLMPQNVIDIIRKPIEHFDIEIPKEQLYRICTISCGYPHYPHLIGSKLLAYLIRNDERISGLGTFQIAINDSIRDSHPYLMDSYNKATMRRTNNEKSVIWAFADHRDIDQNINDVLERCKSLRKRCLDKMPQISDDQFKRITYNLLKSEYGSILSRSGRQLFYRFTDPLMRGFARLAAASEGVELAIEEFLPT